MTIRVRNRRQPNQHQENELKEKTSNLAVKERPMLFKGAMVRALLDGSKTQTRRIVKDLPNWEITEICSDAGGTGKWMPNGPSPSGKGMAAGHWRLCPHGKPGDRLWVRETHAQVFDVDIPAGRPVGPVGTVGAPARPDWKSRYVYLADGAMPAVQWHHVGDSQPVRWTPSIHMPRAASRVLLEIVSVRVERLNDCSEVDAVAEGVKAEPCDHVRLSCEEIGCCGPTARGMYAALWDQINGAGAWAANPWVWVVEFKRVTP